MISINKSVRLLTLTPLLVGVFFIVSFNYYGQRLIQEYQQQQIAVELYLAIDRLSHPRPSESSPLAEDQRLAGENIFTNLLLRARSKLPEDHFILNEITRLYNLPLIGESKLKSDRLSRLSQLGNSLYQRHDEKLEALLMDRMIHVMGTLLMISLIILLFGHYLGHQILRPLHRLKKGVAGYNPENSEHRLQWDREEELSEVASAFNTLANRLSLEIASVKQAAHAIQLSEAKFKALFQYSPLGMVVSRPDGSIDDTNIALQKMVGYQHSELVKMGWQPFSASSDQQSQSLFNDLIQGERVSFKIERPILNKVGKELWVNLNVSAVRNSDDKISFLIVLLENISERKEQEQELIKLRTAVEQSPITIVITDYDGKIEYANPYFTQLTGYQPEEVIGLKPSILKSGYHDNEFYKNLWDTLKAGKIWHGEIHNKNKVGEHFWEEASIAPLFSPKGEVTHFVAVKQNITLRKKAEDTIRQLHYRNSMILDTAGEGIYGLDCEGRTTFANIASAQMTLWSEQEMLNRHQHTMIHHSHADGTSYPQDECPIYMASRDGQIHQNVSGEVFWRKDGSSFPVEYTSTPMIDADRVIGSVVVFRDVTKQQQLEQSLREATYNAEAASRAKGNFLANMSHEIRTPMHGIIGMSNLALQTELDTKQRKYLERIQHSGTALLGLLNEILDYSKIEAGKLELEEIDFDLQELVNNSLSLFEAVTEAKGVRLASSVDPALPRIYIGDVLRISQILNNLLGNAVKFTEQGAIEIEINTEERLNQKLIRIRFSVSDSGIGISEDQIPHLFSQFTQADNTTTRRFGGTGLGLSICKELTHLMGGEIGAKARSDGGSCFYFILPLKISPEQRRLKRPDGTGTNSYLMSSNELSQLTRPIHGASILLVEDSQTNQILAKELLEQMQFIVDVADNGRIAVDKVSGQKKYDAILMDIQMPQMDGIEATRRIRSLSQGRDIPIIAMTAAVLDTDMTASAEAGMQAHISKPIDLKFLAKTLVEQIDKSVNTAPNQRLVDNANTKDAGREFSIEGVALDQTAAKLNNNWTLLRKAVNKFGQQFADFRLQMEELIKSGQFADAERLAHTLKGAAATIGADSITSLAKEAEASLKMEKVPQLSSLYNELEGLLLQIKSLSSRE